MRSFTCAICGQPLFFENTSCIRCGSRLLYVPEIGVLTPVEEEPEGDIYRAMSPLLAGTLLRRCANSERHGLCNWAIPAESDAELCCSCRLNASTPDVSESADLLAAWKRIEAGKRRLLYTLYELGLPVREKTEDRKGLAFTFEKSSPDQPVFTGHSNGLITINLDEADAPFREKQRVELGEQYRTVLGHFRHEVGHYYWFRILDGSPLLEEARELFGDDREDYAAALERHYTSGKKDDWHETYVSAYASMHPWEDWAESFAHYLHMVDTLETANDHAMSMRPTKGTAVDMRRIHLNNFDELISAWYALTVALNNISRSMGQADLYPFVLTDQVVSKLRFIDRAVSDYRAS